LPQAENLKLACHYDNSYYHSKSKSEFPFEAKHPNTNFAYYSMAMHAFGGPIRALHRKCLNNFFLFTAYIFKSAAKLERGCCF